MASVQPIETPVQDLGPDGTSDDVFDGEGGAPPQSVQTSLTAAQAQTMRGDEAEGAVIEAEVEREVDVNAQADAMAGNAVLSGLIFSFAISEVTSYDTTLFDEEHNRTAHFMLLLCIGISIALSAYSMLCYTLLYSVCDRRVESIVRLMSPEDILPLCMHCAPTRIISISGGQASHCLMLRRPLQAQAASELPEGEEELVDTSPVPPLAACRVLVRRLLWRRRGRHGMGSQQRRQPKDRLYCRDGIHADGCTDLDANNEPGVQEDQKGALRPKWQSMITLRIQCCSLAISCCAQQRQRTVRRAMQLAMPHAAAWLLGTCGPAGMWFHHEWYVSGIRVGRLYFVHPQLANDRANDAKRSVDCCARLYRNYNAVYTFLYSTRPHDTELAIL